MRDRPWLNVTWHARPDHLQLQDNWVGDDPGFVRPITDAAVAAVAADFDLRPEAPAWKVGFERLPVERMGLQADDPLRRELRGRGR